MLYKGKITIHFHPSPSRISPSLLTGFLVGLTDQSVRSPQMFVDDDITGRGRLQPLVSVPFRSDPTKLVVTPTPFCLTIRHCMPYHHTTPFNTPCVDSTPLSSSGSLCVGSCVIHEAQDICLNAKPFLKIYIDSKPCQTLMSELTRTQKAMTTSPKSAPEKLRKEPDVMHVCRVPLQSDVTTDSRFDYLEENS